MMSSYWRGYGVGVVERSLGRGGKGKEEERRCRQKKNPKLAVAEGIATRKDRELAFSILNHKSHSYLLFLFICYKKQNIHKLCEFFYK